jgi:hypothetical protein
MLFKNQNAEILKFSTFRRLAVSPTHARMYPICGPRWIKLVSIAWRCLVPLKVPVQFTVHNCYIWRNTSLLTQNSCSRARFHLENDHEIHLIAMTNVHTPYVRGPQTVNTRGTLDNDSLARSGTWRLSQVQTTAIYRWLTNNKFPDSTRDLQKRLNTEYKQTLLTYYRLNFRFSWRNVKMTVLLGCCAVYSGRSLPTFQRCLLPPSSGQ